MILFLSPLLLKSEGTKQLRQNSTEKSSLQLYDRSETTGPLRKFATYEADSNARLYFTVLNYQNETVMTGFRMDQYTDTIYFRIKDSQGNIVSAARMVPKTGAGFISAYSNAVNGPHKLPEINSPSGYVPLTFAPPYNGDFYMEFNVGDPEFVNPDDNTKKKHVFEFFDLSVVDKNIHKIIEGRVWSRAWDFTTQATTNVFTANLYIYADDGIVTRVNFNGIQPYGFVVSSNQTGTKNTGTAYENRQSVDGNLTYPQYKIFLTYPDPIAFKAGQDGILLSGSELKCSGNDFCFFVNTTSSGYLELLLEFNNTPGYQPGSTDVLLNKGITQAGKVCMDWDGKNGLGEKVNPETPFTVIATFQRGLTHLPLYDVEGHPKGYIVEMVVPQKKSLKLFWDDSQIVNGSQELNGCTPDTVRGFGCHGWALNAGDPVSAARPIDSVHFGNNRTVNTWWYATLQTDTFYVKTPPLITADVVSDHQVEIDTALLCEKNTIQLFSKLTPKNDLYQYNWSIENGSFSSNSKEPTVTGLDKDTYVNLSVYNPENFCSTSATYFIKVRNIAIPNLITPNGDEKNDTFIVKNLFPESKIQIFNRWGDRIFKATNYANDWDAPGLGEGVYFYEIESGGNCGLFRGWVEVVR